MADDWTNSFSLFFLEQCHTQELLLTSLDCYEIPGRVLKDLDACREKIRVRMAQLVERYTSD